MRRARIAILFALVASSSVSRASPGNDELRKLADRFWDEELAHNPAWATQKGVHDHDDELIDLSPAAIEAFVGRQRAWLPQLDRLRKSLSGADATDAELLWRTAKAHLVELEQYRPQRRHPRFYLEQAIGSVYLIVKRTFAPADRRIESVIARERAIPRLLASARQNLDDVPRISVLLALEELPANIEFLEKDTVQAFAKVEDKGKQQRLRASTRAATTALSGFGVWLQQTVLPAAKTDFAIGERVFRDKLAADEMIEAPLDRVLARGEAELERLRKVFVETAAKIDPKHAAKEVQAALAADHGRPETLIADVQSRLAGLRKFLVEHSIVTVPSPVMPIVQESPPFMRAFTLASMDTPGPYESKATEAYYNVTLPDPKWTAAEVESYMRGGFSRTIIDMVSIHEAFPGHYTQFLWMPRMTSRTRKLYDCASNAEGWAHYAEQMMLDAGVGDEKLRLAQTQEALLRAARYVVGIRMHTRGMTLAQATDFFEQRGMQSRKVAEMEAKRGTEDPTYLYYTHGKLDFLALRDEYRKKVGAAFNLRTFHDAVLSSGAIPLPLLRRELLEGLGR